MYLKLTFSSIQNTIIEQKSEIFTHFSSNNTFLTLNNKFHYKILHKIIETQNELEEGLKNWITEKYFDMYPRNVLNSDVAIK